MNIRKGYSLKIIYFLITLVFLSVSVAPAMEMPQKAILRNPLLTYNAKDESRLINVMIWENIEKYSVTKRYNDYSDFIGDISEKLLGLQSAAGGGIFFVVIGGSSGGGKSYASTKISERIREKGGNAIVLRRDWFIGKRKGKLYLKSERIRSILEQMRRFKTEPVDEITIVKNLRKKGEKIRRGLALRKNTIVIMDGASDMEDEIDKFDFKILITAQDLDKPRERKIARGAKRGYSAKYVQRERMKHKSGISDYLERFGANIDLIVKMDDIEKPVAFFPSQEFLRIVRALTKVNIEARGRAVEDIEKAMQAFKASMRTL